MLAWLGKKWRGDPEQMAAVERAKRRAANAAVEEAKKKRGRSLVPLVAEPETDPVAHVVTPQKRTTVIDDIDAVIKKARLDVGVLGSNELMHALEEFRQRTAQGLNKMRLEGQRAQLGIDKSFLEELSDEEKSAHLAAAERAKLVCSTAGDILPFYGCVAAGSEVVAHKRVPDNSMLGHYNPSSRRQTRRLPKGQRQTLSWDYRCAIVRRLSIVCA